MRRCSGLSNFQLCCITVNKNTCAGDQSAVTPGSLRLGEQHIRLVRCALLFRSVMLVRYSTIDMTAIVVIIIIIITGFQCSLLNSVATGTRLFFPTLGRCTSTNHAELHGGRLHAVATGV